MYCCAMGNSNTLSRGGEGEIGTPGGNAFTRIRRNTVVPDGQLPCKQQNAGEERTTKEHAEVQQANIADAGDAEGDAGQGSRVGVRG